MPSQPSTEERGWWVSGGASMGQCLEWWWDQLRSWRPSPPPRTGCRVPRYVRSDWPSCSTWKITVFFFLAVAQSGQLAHRSGSRHGQRSGCGHHHDAFWRHQHPSLQPAGGWVPQGEWNQRSLNLVFSNKRACFADLLCVAFRDAFTADFWTVCWKCAKPRVCWGCIRGWARSSFVWPHTQSSAWSSGTWWDNRWERGRAAEAAKTSQTKWSKKIVFQWEGSYHSSLYCKNKQNPAAV